MTTVTIGGRTADTYPGVSDTQIRQNFPTTPDGSGDRWNVSNAVSGQAKKALLLFSGVSNIAGPVSVVSATISAYRLNAGGAVNRNAVVRKVLRSVVASQATWNVYSTGNNWQTAGALGALDVDPTILATGSITAAGGVRNTFTGLGLAALYQDVINGVIANPWIVLELEDYGIVSGTDFDLASNERATESQRPFLEIVYNALSPNPGTVDDVTVSKDDGTVTVTVRIPLGAIIGGQTINYDTQDGTATQPVYYTQTSGSLVFAAGETVKTFTIPITP